MKAEKLTKLGLKLPTDPRWTNIASMSLEDILTDHAFCEQKAASACISLIQKYAYLEKLVEQVSPIVTEEWGHFRMVLAEIKKRNFVLGKQRKDEYVNALQDFVIKGGSPENKLLDMLLICALIEARSCERFRLLSIHLEDEYLKNFYRIFMESEAGHYKMFLSLAKEYIPSAKVNKRWKEWLDYEKVVLSNIELRGDRMH